MDLELLKTYAVSLVGVPYKYGGDNPISGFDCSGLVSELCRASGLVPWSYRENAQQIYTRFSRLYRTTPYPALGDISFYGASEALITHVAFCLDTYSILEAGGGDERTLYPSVAAQQDAFVRIRPWNYRKFQPIILRPVYPTVVGGRP
jgi:cell wall-associated NlpC family hydrolase